MAMMHEADPLIKLCALKPLTSLALSPPLQGFEGHFAGVELFVVVNGSRDVRELNGSVRVDGKGAAARVEGVSVVPAAISTWEAVKVLRPQLVINAGTAGGVHARGAKRGQVYWCSQPLRYVLSRPDIRPVY